MITSTEPGDLQCAQMLQDLQAGAPQHAVNTQIVRRTKYGAEVTDAGCRLSGQSLFLIGYLSEMQLLYMG